MNGAADPPRTLTLDPVNEYSESVAAPLVKPDVVTPLRGAKPRGGAGQAAVANLPA